MSQTITFRVPDETAAWLKSSARRAGRSVNEIGSRLLSEAQRLGEFAHIEFKTINGERHACIQGHMQVWMLIQLAQAYHMDAEKVADHLSWPIWLVQAGFNYYEAFPDEIDLAIDENRSMTPEKLKRLLPSLEIIEIPIK